MSRWRSESIHLKFRRDETGLIPFARLRSGSPKSTRRSSSSERRKWRSSSSRRLSSPTSVSSSLSPTRDRGNEADPLSISSRLDFQDSPSLPRRRCTLRLYFIKRKCSPPLLPPLFSFLSRTLELTFFSLATLSQLHRPLMPPKPTRNRRTQEERQEDRSNRIRSLASRRNQTFEQGPRSKIGCCLRCCD